MQNKTGSVYLVRHGESVANSQSIYQGQTHNTQLSTLGQRQVQALGERFRKVSFDRVITSPLLRTRETATQIGLNIEVEPRLLETNHGEWEGRHKNEIKSYWPGTYTKWLSSPKDATFPGGESFLGTQSRVLNWWEEIINNPGNFLVVSHDNILRIIIADVLKMDLNNIWRFHLQPTAVTIIEIRDGKPRVVCLNDASHLVGLQGDLSLHAL